MFFIWIVFGHTLSVCVCVCVCVCVRVSKMGMMELTLPEDSDLAIDLQAIYTPFLSEDIGVGVTQSARGASLL